MSRRASPTLIGSFVIGAVVLALVVIVLVSGGSVFQKRPRYVVYFEGAAQGLQIGAPVLFLGVKVGTVKQIQLGIDEETNRFSVRVTMEMEPNVMRSKEGKRLEFGNSDVIRGLIEQGVRAQLRIQSLLTGQLYVDLDFHPEKPAVFVGRNKNENEIPSIPTPVQEFTAKIESFPWNEFFAETAAIGKAIKALLDNPATLSLPGQLESTLVKTASIAGKLDKQIGPTMVGLDKDLSELEKTLVGARAALEKIQMAAESMNTLANPDAPVITGLKQASEQLSGAAQAVSLIAGEQSPSVVYLNNTLQEMSKAARSLRILAETLEQQPESLVRGKKIEETNP